MIRSLFIAASLAVAGSCSWAATEGVEDEARKALASRQYARVIELYEPQLAAGRPLGDLGQYRRAIAFNQLGRPLDAWRALAEAIAANPAGTFATSRARLTELKDSILARCKDLGRPGCIDELKPAFASTPEPVASQAPVAAASTPAATSEVTTLAAPQRHAPAAAAQAQGNDGAKPGTAPDGPATQTVSLVTLGLSVLVLAVVVWIARSNRLRDGRFPAGQHSLEGLRDDVASMLSRLAAGGQNSALYEQLQALLPLLELEAGRSAFRATGSAAALVPKDRRAAELAAHLARKPPDALSSPACDIEAAFRRPVQ